MKKLALCIMVALSSNAFASDLPSYSIGDILKLTTSSNITRRCISDQGCRPGAEICVGGQCIPSRDGGPRCRSDRECHPRHCINSRCQ